MCEVSIVDNTVKCDFEDFSGGRITLQPVQIRAFQTQQAPLLFKASQQLCAEPLKKKRKADPMTFKKKQEKLMKKLDKELRRIERGGKVRKPVDEFEDSHRLSRQLSTRKREMPHNSREELESRVVIMKEWGRYKTELFRQDSQMIQSLVKSQEKALEELRKESEELYQKAIEIDENMYGLVLKGPYHTPPITEYQASDGEYIDVTRTDFEIPYKDPAKS